MNPILNFERIYIERNDFYTQEMINRHINRYLWAIKNINKNDFVLDVCCGSGYGSNIIAQHCKFVRGIDINKAAIQYAKTNYESKRDNLKYYIKDLSNLKNINLEQNWFDTVVCIEAIEHFTKNQAENIIDLFSDVLTSNGKLILTTPDITFSTRDNEYHKYEYSMFEITELIINKFYIESIITKDKFFYIIARKKNVNN